MISVKTIQIQVIQVCLELRTMTSPREAWEELISFEGEKLELIIQIAQLAPQVEPHLLIKQVMLDKCITNLGIVAC